jgi:hypothetical protein
LLDHYSIVVALGFGVGVQPFSFSLSSHRDAVPMWTHTCVVASGNIQTRARGYADKNEVHGVVMLIMADLLTLDALQHGSLVLTTVHPLALARLLAAGVPKPIGWRGRPARSFASAHVRCLPCVFKARVHGSMVRAWRFAVLLHASPPRTLISQ